MNIQLSGALSARPQKIQHHHHARQRHAGGVAREQAEREARRSAPRGDGEIRAHLVSQRRRYLGQRQQRFRVAKHQHRHDGERQRQPHALADLLADLGVAARAEEMRDGWSDRQQHPMSPMKTLK
jgi:hypothetical protein